MGTKLFVRLPFLAQKIEDCLYGLIYGLTLAMAMKGGVLREAVRAPAFMHVRGTSEVFKHGFQLMGGFRIAAQTPVRVELRIERTTPALVEFGYSVLLVTLPRIRI